MFAFRSHLDVATVALVLVVPVVIGVVIGGVRAGTVAVLAGFLLYDLVFIRPYYTLRVGAARNWLALLVYVLVMLMVARVVGRLRVAEDEARNRESDTQRLLELSELLIEDRPLADLLPLVVSIVRDAFGCESVVLLLPDEGRLHVVARGGRELTAAELSRVSPAPGVAASLTPPSAPSSDVPPDGAHTETIVLSAPGRPVGLIGLVGARLSPHRRALAGAFGNHIAVAIERAQLQEQAMRMSVLEEADRLRGALVGAVSHDLRTPLATIKASASTLLDDDEAVGAADRLELLALIDQQADRLARLVTNLLDMSRIESGSLVVNRKPLDLGDLIGEAVASLRPLVAEKRIVVRLPPGLPTVDADHVLLVQVIVNLLENAVRFAPEETVVEVTAEAGPNSVHVAVTDHGPGFTERDRVRIFGLARPSPSSAAALGRPRPAPPAAASGTVAARTDRTRANPSGGSGVGLAIAKAFVDAHGGVIWAENVVGGGGRVAFSLPLAFSSPLDSAAT
jgi:two-component system sensor histidine kinase KdpD